MAHTHGLLQRDRADRALHECQTGDRAALAGLEAHADAVQAADCAHPGFQSGGADDHEAVGTQRVAAIWTLRFALSSLARINAQGASMQAFATIAIVTGILISSTPA